jgi:hypothetical protein
MDWSRLPPKFLTSWVDAPRCGGRAHSYGGARPHGSRVRHDFTRELQLICFNLDGAAVQLGVSLSWGLPLKTERNGASSQSQLGYRWRPWKQNPSIDRGNETETHLRTSVDDVRNGLSLRTGVCQAAWQYPELSRRPVQMPPGTTCSQ